MNDFITEEGSDGSNVYTTLVVHCLILYFRIARHNNRVIFFFNDPINC